MKPASFDYVKPAELNEAVELLAAHEEAKVLAGGQSLVPLMNFRLARPEFLIDINGLNCLDFIREDGDVVSIGSITREGMIEASAPVTRHLPVLAEATRWIGHPAIRNRGTIGGSLAHNDPSAEYPLVTVLLDADIRTRSLRGDRQIPAQEFLLSYLSTSLDPDEVITEVRFPKLPADTGWGFQEVARRRGDFAIVAVCATLTTERDIVRDVRIAVGGAGPVAFRATPAESVLKGQRLTSELLSEAASRAADASEPDADVHASAEYRKHLVSVLTKRALQQASDKVWG